MKLKISAIALLVFSVLFSTVAFAARSSGVEVTIVNKTGKDIEAFYISPVTRNDWERYYSLDDVIYKGTSTDIYVKLRRDVRFWDIRCTYTNGREEIWYGVDLYGSEVVILRRGGDFDTVDRD